MSLLLDTHAALWLLAGDSRLGSAATQAVIDPARKVQVSVVSLWEMAVKIRIGKLAGNLDEIIEALAASRITVLPLAPDHLLELMRLPWFEDHRDPFDHLIAAQARAENLVLVSADRNMPRYGTAIMPCDA
ncbi:PilT protein domain protein [Magnetospirillum sp. LM-5]|uniref:type II toxin-antitoxin system VapC family toxin n=1 Tax=Magnetospirillum sp. LM-5 TaxID=2681466 RepID=UPI00137F8570|nr:type II toxin-antitoxin system VapC family toxin [Magnetospirillum sp. LM-5]CAA7620211.1 PilT protein domain protein [Magnetospirillum sp. LM-5]